MANNIGNGNGRVGNGVMWDSSGYGTGAMVVQNWTDTNSASWQLFDQKVAAVGGRDVVKAVQVMICIFPQRATDQEVRDMIQAAKDHTNPGTHIFLSGQPVYNEGHECSLAGDGGADWTDEEAQKIAAEGIPDVSYLGTWYLDNNAGEVMSDSCHATSAGEDSMALQANDYFPAS
jgi:hypothetical protein